jgi:putative YhdH/YhfP family quinone oxidoreductase
VNFKAYRVHTVNGQSKAIFEDIGLDDLDGGEVVIRVEYSCVNYKDAMAARGIGKNVRTARPCVIGVDLAGVVHSSADQRFAPGDQVVATNFKLGNEHDGGYAEFARLPAAWIVPIPPGLNTYEAMALGTAGLTAALAITRLEASGLTPAKAPVALSGSTGGVGTLAIDMLSKRGYEVIAISGKRQEHDFLRAIGASAILDRKDFLADKAPIARTPPFAAAIDNVGGQMLDRLAANMRPHGRVAITGMIDVEFSSTVLPHVLRAVDYLGINVARQMDMETRVSIWKALGADLKPLRLGEIARRIPFEGIDAAVDKILEGENVGRTVVCIQESGE